MDLILRRNLKAILPFLVLGLAAGVSYYLITSKAERTQPELKEKVWQVDVLSAKRTVLSPGITLYGRVESPEQLQAAAPGAGIVDLVSVRSGDFVAQNELLVSLDQRDFESQLIQAESELRELQSQSDELKIRHQSNLKALKTERELLKLAEQEVGRMQELKNQKLGAESTLNEARSNLGRQQLLLQSRQFEVDSFASKTQKLEAQQSRVQATIDEARLRIERSQVIAPFDAIINSAPVSVGDRVAIGQTLLSLYPVNSLEVRAHIPFRYIADIRAAIAAEEKPQAQLNHGEKSASLTLKRLAGDAKPTGIDAYFESDSNLDLRPGELLSLNLSLPEKRDVFAIPFQAIYGNSRLYLMRQGRLAGIDVETVGQYFEANSGAQLLIKSNEIEDGDLIVTTHLSNAVSGLKVRTENDVIE